RLIGTTKPTIAAVRDRTHWNAPNIKPRNPVMLGLCTQRELDEALTRARRRVANGEPIESDDEVDVAGAEYEDEDEHHEELGS
ncbi:MAG TPA: cell cycle transcriptional regulator TrcR, partial [Azospirillaceae bacterium]|nr:cell cycle transcriptional regulator TrcR [Azospirillaceae bacterium]